MTTEWCFLPFYAAPGSGGLSLRRLRKPPPGVPSVRTGLVGPGESPPETEPPLPVPSPDQKAPFSSHSGVPGEHYIALLCALKDLLWVVNNAYHCSAPKEGWRGMVLPLRE